MKALQDYPLNTGTTFLVSPNHPTGNFENSAAGVQHIAQTRTIDMNLSQAIPCSRSGAAAVALVATLDAPPATGDAVRRLQQGVSWLQVRADRVGDVPASWLREAFGCRLLYTLGGDARGPDRRERLIAAAAQGYDLVELDAQRDISGDLLARIPVEQRLICWRGTAVDASELASTFRRLSRIEARSYLLIVHARRASDGLAPLLFLRSAGRCDVTAYADGEFGLWSRILAPFMGAPLVFAGRSDSDPETLDGLTPERMIAEFGLPSLPTVDRICGIVGAGANRSASPGLHNAACRALGYPGLFLPFRVDAFEEFWREVVESRAFEQVGLRIQGFTVASPNKEAAATMMNSCSRASRRSASANLVFRRGTAWVATTTDPAGVLANLDQRTIRGQRAAVIGCGGSGRAIAAALNRAGAHVTLVNRCPERGEQASRLLGLPFAPISRFSADSYDLIINATPVGSQGDALPFTLRGVARHAVVVDLVYAQDPTPLVESAQASGVRVVDGREVLLAQVERQFTRMTGLAPPPGLVAERLGLAPRIRAG
jgi:3-dehydroquinate dehydratase / shikimate dehydrogenase